MNILMLTNSFKPQIGGVAKSVETFSKEYIKLGHNVLIIAPKYKETIKDENNIIRTPSIKKLNNSEFSVGFPFVNINKINKFNPDVVHSHHPFGIGLLSVLISKIYNIPTVFTYHTMYEHYLHYLKLDNDLARKITIKIIMSYCNSCDKIFVPTKSIKNLLISRNIKSQISIIPYGIEKNNINNKLHFRKVMNIPKESFVIGHVGRLTKEKNLLFLSMTISKFLKMNKNSYFLLIGNGPVKKQMIQIFENNGVLNQVKETGYLSGSLLKSAYSSMDVFAFTSKTETQGIVLLESMMASVPVIAINSNGVRDVVIDKKNGRLVNNEDIDEFVNSIEWIKSISADKLKKIKQNAKNTSNNFSIHKSVEKSITEYSRLLKYYNERIAS